MRTVGSGAVLRLEASARSTLGLFTAADARAFGVSSGLLGYHSRPDGRWSRLLPGVYSLAGERPDRRRELLSALLWAGDEAVLSHRAAGWVLGLDGIPSCEAELWAPRSGTPSKVIVHRGVVGPQERSTSGGLRHTNAIRTLIDLASVVGDDTLELALESALRKDPSHEAELRLAAGGNQRGSRRLRRVLARREPGAPPTGSELETRYLQVIRTVEVPPPLRQYEVLEGERCLGRLDLCWPEVGLWVELDGRKWHDRPQALLYDRHRQNELASHLQWVPLRFTWEDVTERPTGTARFTETAYRRRAAATGP
ncbi:MAG: hypothetical protein ACYDAD_12200 [Acidimicrobiales bacterium]